MTAIDITIAKPAYGGSGLAFHDGKAVFVPFTLPGERLRVKISTDKRDYSFAEIVEILEPSPERIQPECPNFFRCGGCNLLHAGYPAELNMKRAILAESLRRTGGMAENTIPDISTISGNRFHYRSHATVKCSAGKTGFFAGNTNRLVPFPETGCLLLNRRIAEHLFHRYDGAPPEFRIAVDRSGAVLTSLKKESVISEEINGIQYDRDIACFFQANLHLRTAMLDTVCDYASIRKGERFFDIGCGVGFFALQLSRSGGDGTGIDMDATAIYWAGRNAAANSINGVRFIRASFDTIGHHAHNADVVVIDPPRAGIPAAGRNAIMHDIHPQRIVYVSCNPATFARDVAHLGAGGYMLKRIALIDMFPGTHHIECIGLLE